MHANNMKPNETKAWFKCLSYQVNIIRATGYSDAYHDIRQCSISWFIEAEISCYNSWQFDSNCFQATIYLARYCQTIIGLFQLGRKCCLQEKMTTPRNVK